MEKAIRVVIAVQTPVLNAVETKSQDSSPPILTKNQVQHELVGKSPAVLKTAPTAVNLPMAQMVIGLRKRQILSMSLPVNRLLALGRYICSNRTPAKLFPARLVHKLP